MSKNTNGKVTMIDSSWEMVDYYQKGAEQKALIRDFKFSNFAEALVFVNKVGEIAEKQQHHPDINLSWGFVRIWTTTHDAHGITEKDHKLANSIDNIALKS